MKNFKPHYQFKDSVWSYAVMILVTLLVSLLIPYVFILFGATEKTFEADWFAYFSMFLTQILFLGVFLIYSRVTKVDFIKATNIKAKPNYLIALIAVGLGLVSMLGFNQFIGLTNEVIYLVFGKIAGGPDVMVSNFGIFLLCVFLSAVLPAVIEELFFRGLIFNGLKKQFKPWTAITLSALMFAIMHFSIHQFVYQFILGMILAALVYYTGSIIYGMIMHFINNLAVWVIFYAFGSGDASAVKWGVGEVALAIGIAVAASGVIIGLIYLIKRIMKKQPTAEEELSTVDTKPYEELSEYEMKATNKTILGDKGGYVFVMVVASLIWIVLALA